MQFQTKANTEILKRFTQLTNDLKEPNADLNDGSPTELIYKRLNITREIAYFMSQDPKSWDDLCKFNLSTIGDKFINTLSELTVSLTAFNIGEYKSKVDLVYIASFRFLCELDFMLDKNSSLDIDLHNIRDSVIKELSEGNDESISSKIIYALHLMPTSILKFYHQSEGINIFRSFDSKIEELKELESKFEKDINIKWKDAIEKKFKKVEDLEGKLDKAKEGFNFVGLYDGFSHLKKQKKSELFWQRIVLFIMSLLILSPLSWQIYEQSSTTIEVVELIPLVSLELILLYFFRVILMNYRSSKTQIMQIELRQTLCQFIQSYTDFAAEMKAKDEGSLEKFENLIFSGILSDDQKLPATFDGITQINDLIKSLKGKSS